MPPKRSAAQMASMARARMASGSHKKDELEHCAPQSLEESLEECRKELSVAQIELAELKATLISKEAVASRLSTWLSKEQEGTRKLSGELAVALQKLYVLQKQLHVEKQGRKRASMRKNQLTEINNSLKANGQILTNNMSNMAKEISGLLNLIQRKEIESTKLQLESEKNLRFYQSELTLAREIFDTVQGKLRDEKKKVITLKKSHKQLIKQHDKSFIAQSKAKYHHLMHKGVYAESTRKLVQFLVRAGCTRDKVGSVVHEVLSTANIQAVGKISRRSVSQIIMEGFFGTQMQLGHEMKNAKSLTLSRDATTHRDISYDSHHVNLQVETYDKNKSQQVYATRFLGINSAVDGSSKESMEALKKIFGDISKIYNESPLGKQENSFLRVIEIFKKLHGIHSDHCAKEKKDAVLLKKQKMQAVYQDLGEDQILDMSNQELLPTFLKAKEKMIKSLGGQDKWAALSSSKQAEHDAKMMEEIVIDLGEDAYKELEEKEKKLLSLFIWTGCGCHKDLNSVKGGNASMMAWWKQNKIEPPVLLANKHNAAALKDGTSKENKAPTPAQERALELSTRGAVKAAQIAGSILNHKDDKKGHHDTFRNWWEKHIGTHFTFPDTSNTRFGSYCEAAIVLVQYLDEFKEYLTFFKSTKQNQKFNHMEQNFWNALHDDKTISELVVLALYGQSISHPYVKAMRIAEKNKVNMLDLGPLHNKVTNHMKKIIAHPELLLGSDTTFENAELNGEEWRAADGMQRILELIPTLPHVRPLLLAFFQGALETWKRFTSEFAPGGLIDEATVEEKEMAWMPGTNDVNEGALGSFRGLMRRQPCLSLLQYNAQAMYFHNNTAAFMQSFFKDEDYQYIHKLARDADGSEKRRKRQLIEHAEERIEEKNERRRQRKAKAAETAQRISEINLCFDETTLLAMKGATLNDQFKAYKNAKGPNVIQLKTAGLTVHKKKIAMIADAVLYHAGTWEPFTEADQSDSDLEEMIDTDVSDTEDEWDEWEDL